jgi:hypothetical protein
VSYSILVLRFLQFLGFGEVAPRSPAPLPRRCGAQPPARARAAPAGAAPAAAQQLGAVGWPAMAWPRPPARASFPKVQPLPAGACPARRGRPPSGGQAPPPLCSPPAPPSIATKFKREVERREEDDDGSLVNLVRVNYSMV